MAVEPPVPQHHKDIVRHLREKISPTCKVLIYRDNQNRNPVPIGHFGAKGSLFFSTIGMCDRAFKIPSGRFEFAACGKLPWLPNALCSSVYWLRDRRVKEWPLVCEDVVRANVRSTCRHMAYVPSEDSFRKSAKGTVRWLLGVPITDAEIGCDLETVRAKVRKAYPKRLWTPATS